MLTGQWRVFVLLLVLLFMEVIKTPAVGSFFSGLAGAFTKSGS